MKCDGCGKRPAVSIAIGKCSACLYAEEVGPEKAKRQIELGEAALAAEAEARRRANQQRGRRA